LSLLELTDVTAGYDGSLVLNGVNLKVDARDKVALLGGNGVGKTTTMMVITGLLRPQNGRVVFDGHDLTKVPAHRIAEFGIAMVPEGRRIFPAMTVWENLQIGAYLRRRDSAFVRRTLERVLTVFPALRGQLTQRGATLSGGQQQMLAVARALMSGPRLLLLDEPSLGLAPIIVGEVFKVLESNWDDDLSLLIAEQNVQMTLQVCNRGYVFQRGKVVVEGPAEKIKDSPGLHTAYLGQRRPAAAGRTQ
jgi:branched-chain amino acid transport system ATP-binding protein